MLPIFKNKLKGQAGVIMKTRTPDENVEDHGQSPERDAAQRLIDAVQQGDLEGVISAIKDLTQAPEEAPAESQESED